MGSRVNVREDGYDPEDYWIVGTTEANPGEGRISHVSPLGQSLLGKRVGDTVTVHTPVGVTEFVILEIQ